MLKIDLSQFVTNYKRSCMVKIRDEWSSVNDLQTYIKQIFKFRKIEFKDACNNCWIPGSEPIDIIKTDKFVELIGVGIKTSVRNKNKNIDSNSINTHTHLEIKKYVKKQNPIDDVTDNIINIVKSNRKRNISDNSYEKTISNNPTDNILTYDSLCLNPTTTPPKKKRKRRIKNGKIKKTTENEQEDNVSPVKLGIKSTVADLSNHLRFDEFGNPVPNTEAEPKKIKFNNCLDTVHPTKPRIFSTVVVRRNQQLSDNNIDYLKINEENDNQPSDKDKVIIKEDKIINNGFELLRNAICKPQTEINSPISNKFDEFQEICNEKFGDYCAEKYEKNVVKTLIHSDDDAEIIKSARNYNETIIDIFQHEDKINKIISISDLLIGKPKLKDILFFKIFKLNDKYEPCLSDYICGKLENIIEIENENYLKISILAGQDELKDPQGKFSLEGEVEDHKTDYLKIQFDELHKSRILKHEIEASV